MHKILITILILKMCGSTQQTAIQNYTSVDIDNFNNIYSINQNLQIEKCNLRDSSIKKWSIANYGINPLIDAVFPLQVVLFFPNNGKTILMDNELNILEIQELYAEQSVSPSHFGRSIDGNYLWYNTNTKTIQKVDNKGNVLLQSNILETDNIGSMQRITDLGTEIWIQDGTKAHQFSPSLQYINSKEGILLRNYQHPTLFKNGILHIQTPQKTLQRQWKSDTLPIALTKKQVLLQTKNGLILQSINYAQ